MTDGFMAPPAAFLYPPGTLSRPPALVTTRPSPLRLAHALHAGRRWVVIGMLLSLHAAMISESGSGLQRLLLLAHFGFFLVWQPFIAAERELRVFSALLLLIITGTILYLLPGWLIVMWMLILLGILGGRVFMAQAGDRKRFYLVAFMYVLTLLLLWVVPELLLDEPDVPLVIERFARDYLPLVIVPLIFLPRGKKFDVVLKDALAKGQMTPELRAHLDDPVVRAAHTYELVSMAVIVYLMVMKPF